ncbi:hypothetical protein PROFUN_16500 [Planoprotostelium fungivorum]|uniref:Uncharacterized protein n=1 Tax=Planoprotostelium fungivorum TaxID=1890364 RepID=A0A2P6MQB7_9EUKA|nr:hypothetical protein PROFUN_16500 [Planoprotostelium fungivorum]
MAWLRAEKLDKHMIGSLLLHSHFILLNKGQLPTPIDSGTPHHPSLPLSTCAQMSRRIVIPPSYKGNRSRNDSKTVQPHAETDTIDRVSTDTKTEKALKRYRILYIEQLIQVQFESHNTRIESPEHLEICTDGSLYKGIASYGAQEINHAELRGILRAITHTGTAHNLTIYSDSFNSVLFCNKGRLQKEKTLRTQKNGNTKIEIKQAIERREAKGLTTKFLHNKQRFGKRYKEIEKGNEEADRLASIAYIRENLMLKTGIVGNSEAILGQHQIMINMSGTYLKRWEIKSKPLIIFFSARGQLPTPNGLRDTTPPKLAPIYLVQSYQLASNGLVAPNGVKLISE